MKNIATATIPPSIDKYQVIQKIGEGFYGVVLHVLDRALHAEKAIKILDIDDPKKYMEKLEEAQILHRCRHKHIVQINEANIFNIESYPKVILDLEYMPHGSLEKAMSHRFISISEAVKHIIDILSGLEYAHTLGFLHRDIKPGNILLGQSISKLSDFGLATSFGTTFCGSPKGYTTHLAPEFFLTNTTTIQTDIFAAGMTLYRVIENISDWKSLTKGMPNIIEHLHKGVLISKIGFSNYIPQSIKRIINKACHPDPTKRFLSAHEMSQSLTKLRFNISWIKIDDFHWSGFHDNDSYELKCFEKRNHCAIEFSKNRRRQAANCKTYPSIHEALQNMHEIISDTTLR